jgi:hypothetical protein
MSAIPFIDGISAANAGSYGLELIIGPEDEAVFLTSGTFPNRLGRQQDCAFYAVIHRRFGLWTHVYRVVPEDRLHGFSVYLERAFAGEGICQARDWLRRVLTPDVKPVAG